MLSVCYSPDNYFIALGSVDSIKIWNVETGDLVNTLIGHTDWVRSVCYSPDNRCIISGGDDWVNSVCYSPDKKNIKKSAYIKLAFKYHPDKKYQYKDIKVNALYYMN